jgi:hypothetical protein
MGQLPVVLLRGGYLLEPTTVGIVGELTLARDKDVAKIRDVEAD